MGGVDSKKFTVETASKETGKKYKQTWTNNMGTKGKVRSSPHPLPLTLFPSPSSPTLTPYFSGEHHGQQERRRVHTRNLHARPRAFRHGNHRRRHVLPPFPSPSPSINTNSKTSQRLPPQETRLRSSRDDQGRKRHAQRRAPQVRPLLSFEPDGLM